MDRSVMTNLALKTRLMRGNAPKPEVARPCKGEDGRQSHPCPSPSPDSDIRIGRRTPI